MTGKFIKKYFYRQRARKVADFYDHWSVKFMSITDTFQGFRTEKIEDTHHYTIQSALLTAGDVILDAGCGVGGPAFYFAQKLNIQIYALSNSTEQIQIINSRKRENRLENITSCLGDYHALSEIFHPEFFSKILFLESLGHSYNPRKALKEAFIVMQKGGSLYIRDLFTRKASAAEDEREINNLIRKANEIFIYNHTYVDSICKLILEIGFSVEYCRTPILTPKSIDHEFEEKLGIAPPKGILFAEPFEILAVKR